MSIMKAVTYVMKLPELMIFALIFFHLSLSSNAFLRQSSSIVSSSSSSSSSRLYVSSSLKEFEENLNKRVLIKAGSILSLITLPVFTSSSAAVDVVDIQPLELASDEIKLVVNPQSIGIGLSEMPDSDRIIVSSIKLSNASVNVIENVKEGFILVSIENQMVEGISKETIGRAIKNTNKTSIDIVFRDPDKFFELLNSTNSYSNQLVTTRIEKTNMLRVQRVEVPSTVGEKSASYGDVVDIIYEVKTTDGTVIESTGDKTDVSNRQFLVLGSFSSQNKENLLSSPGVTIAIKGMVPGERRRIWCPSRLIQSKALKEQEQDKDKELIFDITLVSLNGHR